MLMACRVLVVDDDPTLREMMAQLLELEGFDTDVASDGREALDLLHRTTPLPHVILLDMMMPRMDGWAFREHQARDSTLANIAVVVVSAVPRHMLATVAADRVLSKPVDFDELLATVRAHC